LHDFPAAISQEFDPDLHCRLHSIKAGAGSVRAKLKNIAAANATDLAIRIEISPRFSEVALRLPPPDPFMSIPC
jgi:hypothetical protein